MDVPGFFDESSAFGFTRRFRAELAGSTHLDCAVTRIPWSPFTLPDCDLRRIVAIRLVMAELRATALHAQVRELMGRGEGGRPLRRLEQVLEHGQVRIRVAPLAGWSPDFSIFGDDGGPRSLLIGRHSFEIFPPYAGPTIGAHFGPREARVTKRRFELLWARGHDVGPAILTIVRQAAGHRRLSGSVRRRRNPVDTSQALG